MALKLTPKQERFCQAYIETGNASEAYRRAYNSENMKPQTVNRNAKALLDNHKIATRAEELMAVHQERHNVTVDTITDELGDDRTLAHKVGQAGAAVSATMGKAKLHGLVSDRHEISGRHGGPVEVNVTDIERARVIAAALAKAAKRK